jgi:hypothetical protein
VGAGTGTGVGLVGGPCGRGRFIVDELPLRLTDAPYASLPIWFTRVITDDVFVDKLEPVNATVATTPSLSTL